MKSVVLVLSLMCAVVLANHEHDLAIHLRDNYPDPKFVRPVQEHGDAIDLKIAFSLVNIASIDETNGLLTVSGWLFQSWSDPHLGWEPAGYGDVDKLQFDSAAIWKPDLRGYQSTKESSQPELALITSSGRVMYIPKATYEVQCQHDCDTGIYTCKLVFGSWTYHSGQVNMGVASRPGSNSSGINTQWLQDSPTWELVRSQGAIESKIYSCCPDAYQMLKVTLEIRKKTVEGHHDGSSHEEHSHEAHHGDEPHVEHDHEHHDHHANHHRH